MYPHLKTIQQFSTYGLQRTQAYQTTKNNMAPSLPHNLGLIQSYHQWSEEY